MTELLFVLTAIFVAYVVRVIFNEQKEISQHAQTKPAVNIVAQPVATKPVETIAQKTETPAPSVTQLKEEPKKATETTIRPAVTARQPASKSTLRNPLTHETASATGNYRFMKRWIKEALVAEGLLDKVYKNNELNQDTEEAIKLALNQLGNMDKYRT